jgi:hypothetical protein
MTRKNKLITVKSEQIWRELKSNLAAKGMTLTDFFDKQIKNFLSEGKDNEQSNEKSNRSSSN